MRNEYKLCREQSGHYKVYKNDIEILYPTSKELGEEHIRRQKKIDEKQRLLNKEFEINTISRKDLIEYIGEEQALKLNKEQMKNLARKMGEYNMSSYWDDLTDILRGLDIKLLETYGE